MAVLQTLFRAVALLATATSAIRIWDTPGAISTTVPARCRAALSQNITCSDFLVQPYKAVAGETVVGEAAKLYCSNPCLSSLMNFRTTVIASCGETPYQFWKDSSITQTGKAIADGLVWAQKLVCLKDSTGYCLAEMYAGKKDACSDCYLKYGAAMQESDYGRDKVPEQDFKDLLSTCGVNPTKYPYSYTPMPPTTTSGSGTTSTSKLPSTPTCAGIMYKSKQGDTCKSISLSQSVSTDRFIDVNFLDYNCTTLAAGMDLCVQDKCKLATIQRNQTCSDIVAGRGFSVAQLTSWNPTLKSACDSRLTPNLDALIGRHVCIAAPGQYTFPTKQPSTTQATWTLSSTMFSSWTSGVVETSPTDGIVSVTSNWDPSYTPPTETVNFNKTEHDMMEGWRRYCWITDEDYTHDFDPYDLPDGCQDLYAKYCDLDPALGAPSPALSRAPAVCTPDRSTYNLPPAPDPVTTPQPVQSGITMLCNKFYKVKAGDSCSTVVKTQNVTMDNFYAWNPSVGKDCRNLQVNVYVCVGYDERLG